MNSTETILCAICAISFGATMILLLLSIAARITADLKPRLWKLLFSFGLTAAVVVTLARV